MASTEEESKRVLVVSVHQMTKVFIPFADTKKGKVQQITSIRVDGHTNESKPGL